MKTTKEKLELLNYAKEVGFAYNLLNLLDIGYLKALKTEHFSEEEVDEDIRENIRIVQSEIETEGYKLIKFAGKGSQGIVIIAENDNKRYALKCVQILNSFGTQDKKIMKEVDDEIAAMKKMKSDYVISFLHSFSKKYHKYIVMEECLGTLEQLLASLGGKMNENTFIKYGREIIEGINDIHNQGLVLRDIKLENILIDYQGRVKFCDFGMAGKLNLLNSFAQSSSIKGNFLYYSPEIFPEMKIMIEEICNERMKQKITKQKEFPIEKQSKKSDIYSIGLALISLLGAQGYQLIQKKQLMLPEDFVPNIEKFKNQEKIKLIIKGFNEYLPDDRMPTQQALDIFQTLDFTIPQNKLFPQIYPQTQLKKEVLPKDQQAGFLINNNNYNLDTNSSKDIVYQYSFLGESLIIKKDESFIPLILTQKAQDNEWLSYIQQKLEEEKRNAQSELFVPFSPLVQISQLNVSFFKNKMKQQQKKLLENTSFEVPPLDNCNLQIINYDHDYGLGFYFTNQMEDNIAQGKQVNELNVLIFQDKKMQLNKCQRNHSRSIRCSLEGCGYMYSKMFGIHFDSQSASAYPYCRNTLIQIVYYFIFINQNIQAETSNCSFDILQRILPII